MAEQPAKGSKAKCYLCPTWKPEIDDADDQWCAGCKQVICGEHGESPWGGHEPTEHLDPCGICGENDHEEEDCENDDE